MFQEPESSQPPGRYNPPIRPQCKPYDIAGPNSDTPHAFTDSPVYCSLGVLLAWQTAHLAYCAETLICSALISGSPLRQSTVEPCISISNEAIASSIASLSFSARITIVQPPTLALPMASFSTSVLIFSDHLRAAASVEESCDRATS